MDRASALPMNRTAAACKACYAAKRKCVRIGESCERCIRLNLKFVLRAEKRRGRTPATATAAVSSVAVSSSAAAAVSSLNAHVADGIPSTNIEQYLATMVASLSLAQTPLAHIGVQWRIRLTAVFALFNDDKALVASILSMVSENDFPNTFMMSILQDLTRTFAPTSRVGWDALMLTTRSALDEQTISYTVDGLTPSPDTTGRIVFAIQMGQGVEYFVSTKCEGCRIFANWNQQDWEALITSDIPLCRTHDIFLAGPSRARLDNALREMIMENESGAFSTASRTLTNMRFATTGQELFRVVVVLSVSNTLNACVIFEIIPDQTPLPSSLPLLPFSQPVEADVLQEILGEFVAGAASQIADGPPQNI